MYDDTSSLPVAVPVGYASAVPAPVPVAAAAAAATVVNAPATVVPDARRDEKKAAIPAATSPPPAFSPMQEAALESLRQQGYTYGLVQSMFNSRSVYAKRIWIVDNSGSMNNEDGHCFVETSKSSDVRLVRSTRWAELQQCVRYHIQLARAIEAPTEFRFLNSPGGHLPQRFGVTGRRGGGGIDDGSQQAMRIIQDARPDGYTPLTAHICSIRNEVMQYAAHLQRTRQTIVVVIATDGLPTDAYGYGGESQQRDFVSSLKSLIGLPVSLVIRLCTGETEVRDFYNSLNTMLDLSIEVLSDFTEEAKEVHAHNPWLNYALPLHRMREMGHSLQGLNMLDKRLLSKRNGEIRGFMCMMYGDNAMEPLPEPDNDTNTKSFLRGMRNVVKGQKPQWNPIQKKVKPWVDWNALQSCYHGSVCSFLFF